MIDEVFFEEKNKAVVQKGKPSPYINLSKSVPDDFMEVCYNEILEIAEEFDAFIDKKILETETFVSHSLETDKDLVDMI